MEIDYLAVNRANWDERVPIHVASDFYDVAAFRGGAGTIREFELLEVGDVTGRDLVHLQCHFGLDTLSWARRGARVTGLDFSEAAMTKARELAEDAGIGARFVAADVYDAAEALGETYDIVYTGIGALVWLPDLTRWARTVASLLRPGGFLYLAEFHPFADILDDETGTTVTHDYFDHGPQVWQSPHTTPAPRSWRTTPRSSSSTASARWSARLPPPGCGWSSCASTTTRSSAASARCGPTARGFGSPRAGRRCRSCTRCEPQPVVDRLRRRLRPARPPESELLIPGRSRGTWAHCSSGKAS